MTGKRIFTYEEAAELLPAVQKLTGDAVVRIETMLGEVELPEGGELPKDVLSEYQKIVAAWADSIVQLGLEVKGVWLVDFDSGSGYYCWRYPEVSLQFFHSYEEGFGGRVPLT